MLSSPILRGGNLIVTEQGIREGVRQFLLPLWNTYYFFSLYANASGYEAKTNFDSTDVLDRYLLAKTRDLITQVEKDLNQYDSYSAAARLRDFADVLTNWYVRRSRDRFWEGSTNAFDTLYTVLEIVCRVAAPLLPMVAEEIWRGLTGGRSVHLQSWPEANLLPKAVELTGAMDQVREISSVGSSLRKSAFLRVRLPLNQLTVVTAGAESLNDFADLIADELNIKSVKLVELSLDSANEFGVIKRLTVNARVAGPRLGKNVQSVIQAAKAGDWSQVNGVVVAGGVELVEGEYELDLVADLTTNNDETPTDLIGILGSGGFLILDGKITPALAAEGLARDVIRQIQQARKDSGFDVSDRINLSVQGHEAVIAAIETHLELIKAETLAIEVDLKIAEVNDGVAVGEDQSVKIAVVKR
ncbi:MAG: DUF5915 domain-containing protein [Terrabacter sp.]